MGVKLGQRGPRLQPRQQKSKQRRQPGLAVSNEHRASPKTPRLDAYQILREGSRGSAGRGPTQQK